ncbi:MAG: pilus assembly protein TadG-related protein [Acidimicrobiales bacterium]
MNTHARDRNERGAISIFIAVLGIAFLMVAGLAVDGGRKLGALSEARNIADNAARAGAQHVDTAAYRTTGIAYLDPEAATQAAAEFLAAVGQTGTITVTEDTVTVTVQLQVHTRFLPGPWTVSATESATAVLGVEGAP